MTLTAPVSDAQQRLWFLDRLSPGGAAYNIPTMLPLSLIHISQGIVR